MAGIFLQWRTLYADSTTPVFVPVTGWMSTSGAEEFRTGIELRNSTASFSACVAAQRADTVNNPDTANPITLTAYVTEEGYVFPPIWQDKSSSTQTKQLIRYGYLVATTSGTDLHRADMSAQITSRKKS